MTYNIRRGFGEHDVKDEDAVTDGQRHANLAEIAELIKRSDSDVVMLQEVGGQKDLELLAWLVGASDFQMETDASGKPDSIGVATITRNGVTIPDAPDGRNENHSEQLGKSSAMATPIETPDGRSFSVVNVHTDAETLKQIGDAYLEPIGDGELRTPSGYVLPQGVILAGDFNQTGGRSWVGSGAQDAGLRDAFSEVGVPWGDPRRDSRYDKDIDHVRAAASVGEVTRAQVLSAADAEGNVLSDHRPVIVDYES